MPEDRRFYGRRKAPVLRDIVAFLRANH